MPEQFKIGDWARWSSQAQGSSTIKVAECVAIVPAGESVRKAALRLDPSIFRFSNIDGMALPRKHESYLFALPPRPNGIVRLVYWPRVSGLERVKYPK